MQYDMKFIYICINRWCVFAGSFEVHVNDTLIYSKLKTMALPDYEEVAQVVNNVSQGAEPKLIKGQQPINCVIS